MTQQIRNSPFDSLNLTRHHICTLTNSQMLVLNLQQLQQMQSFMYDIVLTLQQDPKIYAYQYNPPSNSYLFMVPLILYNSTKYNSKQFIQLLCLCSQTITIPIDDNLLQYFNDLLQQHNIEYKYKNGNSVYKIYLHGQCQLTYIDFVTFHAIQYKMKSKQQLLSIKKENGYCYCLDYFKQNIMKGIFDSIQIQIEQKLQEAINQIQRKYQKLTCLERFRGLYQHYQIKGFRFQELNQEIKQVVLERHVPTIADQQYQQIINQQIDLLVKQQINKYYNKLCMAKEEEEKGCYMMILDGIFKKMKKYGLEVNVQKFMFVSNRLIQVFMKVKEDKNKNNKYFIDNLMKRYEDKQRQVQFLRQQIQKLNNKHTLTLSRMNQLSSIQQYKQKEVKTKGNTPLKDSKYKKQGLTIQDLKEPLQIIPINYSPQKLNKTLKNRKKSKQKLKKKDIETKNSFKILRKI